MYGVYYILAKDVAVFLHRCILDRSNFWEPLVVINIFFCAQFVPSELQPGAHSKSLQLFFPGSVQCSFLVSAQYSSPGSSTFNITGGWIVKMGSLCILTLGNSSNTEKMFHICTYCGFFMRALLLVIELIYCRALMLPCWLWRAKVPDKKMPIRKSDKFDKMQM